jgi:hypothetical protein
MTIEEYSPGNKMGLCMALPVRQHGCDSSIIHSPIPSKRIKPGSMVPFSQSKSNIFFVVVVDVVDVTIADAAAVDVVVVSVETDPEVSGGQASTLLHSLPGKNLLQQASNVSNKVLGRIFSLFFHAAGNFSSFVHVLEAPVVEMCQGFEQFPGGTSEEGAVAGVGLELGAVAGVGTGFVIGVAGAVA